MGFNIMSLFDKLLNRTPAPGATRPDASARVAQDSTAGANTEDADVDARGSTIGQVHATLTKYLWDLNQPLYDDLKAAGWSPDEQDNRDMCEPGSLVWILLFENLKNGDIAIANPIRANTYVGDWILKKYLVLVRHRETDGFCGFLITSKGDRMLSSVKGRDHRYAGIYVSGATLEWAEGDIAPFCLRAHPDFSLHGSSMVHLTPRSFPYKTLFYPTGAQLNHDERIRLSNVSTSLFNEDGEQLVGAENIRPKSNGYGRPCPPHVDSFKNKSQNPPVNDGPVWKQGLLPRGALSHPPTAASPDEEEIERLRGMSQEEVVREYVAYRTAVARLRGEPISHQDDVGVIDGKTLAESVIEGSDRPRSDAVAEQGTDSDEPEKKRKHGETLEDGGDSYHGYHKRSR